MKLEAKRILDKFREKKLSVGGFIPFTEFGDAIIWEGGYIKVDAVKEAFQYLTQNNYVIEMNNGLELTNKGHSLIMEKSTKDPYKITSITLHESQIKRIEEYIKLHSTPYQRLSFSAFIQMATDLFFSPNAKGKPGRQASIKKKG